MEKYIQAAVETPKKLAHFLSQDMGLTKRQIRQAKFRQEGICVNGIRSRVTDVLKPGDQVRVLLEEGDRESSQLGSLEGELSVLYEDEDILAVDKPAGLVVHPSGGHYGDSLANLAVGYYRKQGMAVKIRPVGRLDRDTSGIVVFAKNQVAAARLSAQKADGRYQKTYLALAEGVPEPQKGTICAALVRDEEHPMKMRTAKEGLLAVTHYEVAGDFGTYSLLRIVIETGRTHQIRVHMSSAGHPLLGDRLYGTDTTIGRGALHAAACRFFQPFTGEEILLKARLPEDMRRLIPFPSV